MVIFCGQQVEVTGRIFSPLLFLPETDHRPTSDQPDLSCGVVVLDSLQDSEII